MVLLRARILVVLLADLRDRVRLYTRGPVVQEPLVAMAMPVVSTPMLTTVERRFAAFPVSRYATRCEGQQRETHPAQAQNDLGLTLHVVVPDQYVCAP
jgi:hypothetical protein